MLEKKSLFLSAVYSYALSIFVALIASPLFRIFYDKALNPPKVSYDLFFGRSEELTVGGILFSYIFFLPFFTSILVSKRQWLVWLIGAILPVMIFFSEGKHLLWFVIFTLAGGVIGWLIKMTIKKMKR